jgi:hypothetical protein
MDEIYVYGLEDTMKLVQVLLANDYQVNVTTHESDYEPDDTPIYIVTYEISKLAYEELANS